MSTSDLSPERLGSVGCVVIHHRSPETLGPTVTSLISSGVVRDNIVVVDNSENDAIDSVLSDLGQLHVLRTPNAGYGVAADTGAAWLRERRPALTSVLISTHEVVVEPGTVAAMLAGLGDPQVAAVGPVLFEAGTRPERVWSAGGILDSRGLVARHRKEPDPSADFTSVDWLDGALVLYRGSVLAEDGFDPRYFLYLEEVDLHLRLRRQGWRVVVANQGRATQATQGMPAYWAMRNRVYFARKFDLGAAGWAATARVLAQVARRAVRTRNPSSLKGTVRGLRDGWRLPH